MLHVTYFVPVGTHTFPHLLLPEALQKTTTHVPVGTHTFPHLLLPEALQKTTTQSVTNVTKVQ